ncbi:unnamed protein product [Kluyveromyces dobzhanskii CBS 2104]|uniref:WGS project CCBQ000000000 data, contig 00028 n=1 Tax=Kluyveromyces dobzhanskii CBS 2104 TaxID=1427455 RepID=A0A0A8KYU1_9SACH|nr:unnamed protein product [Kluyveromyces dobzhanskii CBS 2104]
MPDRDLQDPFEMFVRADATVSHEASWNHTHFDAMLEILPENLNLDVEGQQQETSSPAAGAPKFKARGVNGSNDNNENDDGRWAAGAAEESAHNGVQSRPIDIVQGATLSTTAGQLIGNDLNLQNGEIAQLWDFNVHEFMMTPSDHSDSATISAPSSFNSEQFTPGNTATGFNATSTSTSLSNNNYNNSNSNNNNNPSHIQNNWNQLLHQHQDYGSNNNSAAYQQHPALFQHNNASQSTIKADEYQHKGPLPRRGSSRNLLIKNDANEDGALPLLTHTTTNLVKKNSTIKNYPTTSLPQYRRGSSTTNLQVMNGPSMNNATKLSKPPTQCYNCETLKTPLWRRDPDGNTLCNACGLFQKLHGTMRPLSLKSDIIKKRNTKKRTKKDEKSVFSTEPQILIDQTSNKGSQSPDKLQRKLSIKHNPGQSGTPHIYNQTALNQNSLSNLNKKATTKSRRSSTSSSNSSKSSSSRSVVPILPKPSPGSRESTLQQFQYQIQMQVSQPNSAASSPRYSNSPRFCPASPSTGLGVSIPRRKSSRTLISQSSSFMAQSLQQLQHQQHNIPSNSATSGVNSNGNNNQPASSNPQNYNTLSTSDISSGNATISAPNSWAANALSQPQSITSPSSPRPPFELFSNPNSQPKKSHKSLLSQQLQSSFNSTSSSPSFSDSNSLGPQVSQTTPPPIPSHHSQPQQISGSSLPAASPRSRYVDTLQQQRGILQYEQQQAVRRKTSTTKQPNVSLPNTTPTAASKPKKDNNVMDDLDWLKFGM